MPYPKIKFEINKNLDKKLFALFFQYKETESERFFNWLINPHPDLKRIISSGTRKIDIIKSSNKYIDLYYGKHQKQIIEGAIKVKIGWQKKDKKFFYLVDDIFKGYKWPRGQYTACATIWGLFPRDIDKKTFQMPYRHRIKNYALTVIAHEMLHLIFYSYVFTRFPKLKNKKYEMKIWEASEVFNAVVQGSPSWLELFGNKPLIYPEHRKKIQRIRKKWRPADGIDKFLTIFIF